MTSAPIMEMAQTGYVPSQTAARTGSGVETVQFSEAMDYASAGGQSEVADEFRVQAGESGDAAKNHAEKSAAESGNRKEIRKADEAQQAEPVSEEEAAEQLQEKTKEIVEDIAEELDVSPEAVEEAMEALGLTVMDLLLQGNMASLVAELKGTQSVDLLTNADLFSQITELTRGVQEDLAQLADSLGMSVEDLEQMIQEQLSVPDETAATETALPRTSMAEGAVESAESQPAVEAVAEETVSTDETNAETKGTASADETVDETDSRGKSHSLTTEREAARTNQETSGRESGQEQGTLQNESLLEQFSAKDLNLPENQSIDKLFEGEFDLQKTRELIDQIADYVKVHHSEKVSSMEIQLNPASLGTVNLQVVAKNGVISAQLAAQDDAVRAALESQVTQLKESLEAQGLKVDAVEVTVASHAFEQNLQQQNQDTEQQAAREKKGARRILNLDELDQDELSGEEISDAERLQIEMMRMGGNKLNFRV